MLITWVLVVAAVGYGLARVFAGYPRLEQPYRVLARREVAFLDAAAEATFPAGGAIPYSGREAGLPGYADRWLVALPSRTRLLIRMLLFLVEHATIFFPVPSPRGWRRFSSLSAEQRVKGLEGWRRSRLFPRRLVFTSLRAILTMGYFAHPPVIRQLGLAPLDLETPVCEADLLYPPIGAPSAAIGYTRKDLTAPSDGTPVDLAGRLHPDYAEQAS
jgi:hypothetical protein